MKKLTVITVCFNAENSILRTIESVGDNKEKYGDLEYIIIDGASNDSTLSIIEQAHKNGIVDEYISEVDSGIYDAMNKGLELAKGRYISFLMADDYYLDLGCFFVGSSDDECIYQFGIKFVQNGCDIKTAAPRDSYLQLSLNNMPIHHPSTFTHQKVFDKYGTFNSEFKVSGDFDWISRCIRGGVKINNINTVTTVMELGGISGLPGYKYKLPENFIIHYKNGVGLILNIRMLLLELMITYLRLIKRRIFG